jgi:histidine ammonia-lyase
MRLFLDGRSLRLDDLLPIARGEPISLAIALPALERVRAAREIVDRHVERRDVVYGLTTGFGKLKNVSIAPGDLGTLQRNLILSHCCGVGEPMPIAEVRVAQVLRLNGLLRGHSGVRPELIDKLVRLFGAELVPLVPQQGSVGASGDLAPLAHMTAAYMGHGEAYVRGERMSASRALAAVGEAPLELAAKEGLALINGTEIMKAVGTLVALRARNLSRAADAILALTVEALLGSIKPFDDRLADLKNSAGQRRVAANVRACLEGSEVLPSHEHCDRVQDPYSLRCAPQVHGAFKTALEHVSDVLEAEMNAVTDNPLVFPETGEVLSAGLFHGQPVSMVLDYLGCALASLANISERRIEQLVNPDLHKAAKLDEAAHLKPFLAADPGLNSGLMIAQVVAASLASENKIYSHPASVDTVPTSANQEDHVSMGVTAARKARTILENAEQVLAIELVCAAQAREFHHDLRAGSGAEAAHAALRKHVAALTGDRYLHTDLVRARDLVVSGELVRAVEAETGALGA